MAHNHPLLVWDLETSGIYYQVKQVLLQNNALTDVSLVTSLPV